eukprot:UN00402
MLRQKNKVAHKAKAVKKAQKKTVKKVQKRAYRAGVNTIHGNSEKSISKKAMDYPLTRQTTLANGLRFAVEEKDSNLATIGVFAHAGSRFENQFNNGVNAFLHRALFKGKKNALEAQIDKMGGRVKSVIDREISYITATVPAENAADAVKILGDVFTNARFTDEDVEAERAAVIQDLLNAEEDVPTYVMNRLHYSAFRGSSLGLNPLGNPDVLKTISKEDIESFFKTHYTGDRMVVTASGPIDEAAKKAFEQSFANIPALPVNGIKPNAGITNFTGSDFRLRDDDMPDAHLAIAYEIPGWNSSDIIPFQTWKHQVGFYNRAQNVAKQFAVQDLPHKMAVNNFGQSLKPFVKTYSDISLFGLYGVALPNDVDLLSDDMVMATIRPVFNVAEALHEESQINLVSEVLKDYEGTEAAATSMGKQIIKHGRRIHPVEMEHRISQVTQGDVQRLAKKYTYDQEFVFSSAGNVYELQDYPFLRKKNTWAIY